MVSTTSTSTDVSSTTTNATTTTTELPWYYDTTTTSFFFLCALFLVTLSVISVLALLRTRRENDRWLQEMFAVAATGASRTSSTISEYPEALPPTYSSAAMTATVQVDNSAPPSYRELYGNKRPTEPS